MTEHNPWQGERMEGRGGRDGEEKESGVKWGDNTERQRRVCCEVAAQQQEEKSKLENFPSRAKSHVTMVSRCWAAVQFFIILFFSFRK
jgi:hypothetical protein